MFVVYFLYPEFGKLEATAEKSEVIL